MAKVKIIVESKLYLYNKLPKCSVGMIILLGWSEIIMKVIER